MVRRGAGGAGRGRVKDAGHSPSWGFTLSTGPWSPLSPCRGAGAAGRPWPGLGSPEVSLL